MDIKNLNSFRSYMSASQTISSEYTWTLGNFDKVEWDYAGTYDTANKRWYAKVAGTYLAVTKAVTNNAPRTDRTIYSGIRKNGSPVPSSTGWFAAQVGAFFYITSYTFVYLNVGDYIDSCFYTDYGGYALWGGATTSTASQFQAILIGD